MSIQGSTRILAAYLAVCAGFAAPAAAHAAGKSPHTPKPAWEVLDRNVQNEPEWFPLSPWLGTLTGGVRWIDKNGENVVLLSSLRGDGVREVFATHAIKVVRAQSEQDTWVVQQWKELIQDCPEDTVLDMKMIGIFDEDRDGTGEVVFTVERACISDVSPIGYAMHVWEGGSDYALYGQTAYCVEDGAGDEVPPLTPDGMPICRAVDGGKVEFSPFFDQSSEPVRRNSRALWAERIPVAGAFAVSKEARLQLLNRMFEPR